MPQLQFWGKLESFPAATVFYTVIITVVVVVVVVGGGGGISVINMLINQIKMTLWKYEVELKFRKSSRKTMHACLTWLIDLAN